jgi:hypothetical protein
VGDNASNAMTDDDKQGQNGVEKPGPEIPEFSHSFRMLCSDNEHFTVEERVEDLTWP